MSFGLRPCGLQGWAACDGNCEKCQTTATTHTSYDPIEIARQFAPKFDKPVVDMVEVVRCRDCKYRNGDKDEPYCSRINPYSGVRVEDEDFCSWGEKNG